MEPRKGFSPGIGALRRYSRRSPRSRTRPLEGRRGLSDRGGPGAAPRKSPEFPRPSTPPCRARRPATPDRAGGARHGFVLGPGRHRGQYTGSSRRGGDMTRWTLALSAAVVAAGATLARPAAGGAEVLLPAATGEGRPGGQRRAQDLHRRGAQGRAGRAPRVGLRRRARRAAGPRQRSDGAGGGAQETKPARVRRDGADRKAQARGEGSEARRAEQAAGGRGSS